MRFPFYLICFACLWLIVFTSNANTSANEALQCYLPNNADISPDTKSVNQDEFTILSHVAAIEKGEFATFSEGVKLLNNDKIISADTLTIDRTSSIANASGNIRFQNNGISISASSLQLNEQEKNTTIKDTQYQLQNSPGHGSADTITIDGASKELVLTSSSFTTCYNDNPDWLMQASKIKISTDKKSLQAYNARFHFFDIPVLYVPYLTIPITNERQSGFLYPKISSSKRSGLTIETPYYLNIANNLDATITPRYMSERGLQLNTEFRYLSGLQSGKIDLEYLQNDQKLSNNDDKRYLARVQHIGTFNDNFRAYVDYSTMSDDNYLVDIGSSQFQSNDAYLYQIGEISYFANKWQTTLKIQDFQTLGNNQRSYKTLPQIEFSSQQSFNNFNGVFDFYSELTHFEHADQTMPTAQRYHFDAGIQYPIITPGWFINSEFRLLQTHYKQKNIEQYSQLEASISRTLPKVRIHSGINFDKKLSLFGQHFNQTLEPQLQYLYIPNKDQNNIALYDTSNLQDDFDGLFRDKRYSGLDRIAQANQLSWGVTSRFLSTKNLELARFSLGRIIYINQKNNINDQPFLNAEKSALAAEVSFHLGQQWQFSSDIQYDSQSNITNKSQTTLDYLFKNNQSIQLNHRYSRNVSGESIEQMSLATNIKVSSEWQFVGRLTRDLQGKRSIESYAGVEYSSCCWGIRFTYHRNINSRVENNNNFISDRDTFDSGFNIQFVYNGINSAQSSDSVFDMLNESIFGYKRPYFLNN